MKITGAIFDFNGTLFFDSIYHEMAWRQLVLNECGVYLSDSQIKDNIHGVPNVIALENLFPLKYNDEQKSSLSKEKEALYRNICSSQTNVDLVRGASRLLDRLKSCSIPITIASASILENIDFFYTTFSLSKWFEKTDIIYDDGSYINKVAMFNDALQKLNTPKESCLIFEDSVSGVRDAITAGFKNIILLHSNTYSEQFDTVPEIRFHADNFDDILAYLNNTLL